MKAGDRPTRSRSHATTTAKRRQAPKAARVSSPAKTDVESSRPNGSRTACPRTSGSQGAASSDSRGVEPHLGLADRHPAGVRQDRQERRAALPECAERRLSPGWAPRPSRRVRSVLPGIGGRGAQGLPCPTDQRKPDLGRHPRAPRRARAGCARLRRIQRAAANIGLSQYSRRADVARRGRDRRHRRHAA